MNWRLIRYIDIYIGIPLAYLFFLLKKILVRTGAKKEEDYKKVLFIKFWGIGNAVMLLPAAKGLRERYPQARLDFLTLSSSRQVSESAHIFDTIYAIDTKSPFVFAITTLKAILVLRRRSYDLVVDFEQFARFSALVCWLIASKREVGFKTKRQHRHFLYTDSVTLDNTLHMTKSFYSLG